MNQDPITRAMRRADKHSFDAKIAEGLERIARFKGKIARIKGAREMHTILELGTLPKKDAGSYKRKIDKIQADIKETGTCIKMIRDAKKGIFPSQPEVQVETLKPV